MAENPGPLSNYYTCQFGNCCYQTIFVEVIQLHHLLHYRKAPQELVCHVCDKLKKWSTEDEASSHIKGHQEKNEDLFSCANCAFKCNKKCIFEDHKKQHSEKLQICKAAMCGATFKSKTGLHTHITTNHQLRNNPEGPDTWSCGICTHTTMSDAVYMTHIRSHWEMLPATEVNPHRNE